MIQVLASLATHSFALLVYPGFATMVAFGALGEIVWRRLTEGRWMPDAPRRRLTPVVTTVGVSAMLASVQLAAPFNAVPGEERSAVIAAVALAFTVWAEIALSLDFVAEPALLLLIQFCWLLAALGPAVQPESLRPQVLGNVVVPALMPAKVACALLYVLCVPALLGLWPLPPPGERRASQRVDLARMLCWFPYCGLFTTLFFVPSTDDVLGLARFFGITLVVAAVVITMAFLMRLRGAPTARALYTRAVTPYAIVVLLVVAVTSILLR